ncbi:glycoprotein [Mejal virus]|uniref:Glycoprotein n=1 Tax=Mejal virus TaxID=2838395 RepID=A0A8E7DNK9_9RHAB|nr:glycoprotein [Mejal virus]QVU40009.1 glycoprotein [Mejal virus]
MIVLLFIKLLLLAHFQLSTCLLPIFFPDTVSLDWKPVLSGSRYCPLPGESFLDPLLKEVQHPVKIPIGKTPPKSDGYLCHGGKWVTTCDFRWYGPKYITHSLHNLTPTMTDCFDAVRKYNTGNLINPGFPPEACGYGTITDIEQNIILITPHHVGVDDYRSVWVDDLFPTGMCRDHFCATTHSSSFWLPRPYSKSNICAQEFSTINLTISFPKDVKPTSADLIFHSIYHPKMSGQNSCKMDFCNRTGIKLSNDEWIGLESKLIISGTDILDLLPPCPLHTEIRSTLNSGGATTLTWDTQRLLDFSLCQNTWDKIEAKRAISPLDLSYLSAKSPGKGVAYTIINKTLHSASARYVRMWIPGPFLEMPMAHKGSPDNPPEVFWAQWFPFGTGYIGPNGLLSTREGVKFPFYLVGLGMLDSDIHSIDEGGSWDHPQIAHAESRLDETEELFFGDTGTGKNPIDLFTQWLSHWKIYIGIIITFLLIYIGIKSLLCLFKLRTATRTPTPPEDENFGSIPLQNFNRIHMP